MIPAQQGVMGWDRFAYSNNSPVVYNDPSGHNVDCGIGDPCPQSTSSSASAYTPTEPTHTGWATAANVLQDLAGIVDSIGTGLELSMGVAGNQIYKRFLNLPETILSWGSTITTGIDDFVVDGRLDSEATFISLGASILGTISPVATFDLIIDVYVSGYNHNAFPGIISGTFAGRDPKVDWLYPEPEQQEQYLPIVTKDQPK